MKSKIRQKRTYLRNRNRLTDREQTCGCQGRGAVGEGLTGSLALVNANYYISSVQLLSCVQLFAAPWRACQTSMSITNSQSLLKLMSIESMMLSSHLIYGPLLLLPSVFPSIRVFSNESILSIRWPRYWSFSFSNSPSNEYLGLISFTIDWFDLLAVQGTLQSLPAWNSRIVY